jgi:triacylglycerol esterase/lipase EstA (alpha/beta hydrolase family)
MAVTVPQLRSPIVLVHGLLGYDRIKIAGWTLKSYFPGIPELLTAAGNRVLIPSLHPTCGVADRATQLKDFLDREVPTEPVHLIGHSMGGLDLNAPAVRYFSVAGQYDGVWIDPTWQLSHRIIMDAEGPNDGLVSVVSAKYGESFEVWEGDHLALVNWPNLIQQARGVWRDRSPEYGKLIARLKEEGF